MARQPAHRGAAAVLDRGRHGLPAAGGGQAHPRPRAGRQGAARRRARRGRLARGPAAAGGPAAERARAPPPRRAGRRAVAHARRRRAGARPAPGPQGRRQGARAPVGHPPPRRPLHLLALLADRRLQGHGHVAGAARVLSGPAGPRLRQPVRRAAPPLQHQHGAQVEPRAADAAAGAQRRDQHAARQPRVDARPGAGAGGSGVGRAHRGPAARRARRQQRLRRARQAGRAAGAQRPQPARGPDDDHAGRVRAGGGRGGDGGGGARVGIRVREPRPPAGSPTRA